MFLNLLLLLTFLGVKKSSMCRLVVMGLTVGEVVGTCLMSTIFLGFAKIIAVAASIPVSLSSANLLCFSLL